MFITTLLIIVGTLLPDAPLSCRVVATSAGGYDFARVHVGECVTIAADGAEAQYVVTMLRVEQALGGDDGYGEFAFDMFEAEGDAFLYKLLERHALIVAPPRMRYGGV